MLKISCSASVPKEVCSYNVSDRWKKNKCREKTSFRTSEGNRGSILFATIEISEYIKGAYSYCLMAMNYEIGAKS